MVHQQINNIYPPKLTRHYKKGVCIWLTGLSGSGKTTIANVLDELITQLGNRVTLLDGDQVRTHLSKDLGYSRKDRDENIRRIGFVARKITYHGGIVICAVISPYQSIRNEVRNQMKENHFIEVFVNTPLNVCEKRDPKGLYAKFRRGEITGLTGMDDPYEPPSQPEIILNTVNYSPSENADIILRYLKNTIF